MNFSQSFYNDNEQTNYETAYTILRRKEFEKGGGGGGGLRFYCK